MREIQGEARSIRRLLGGSKFSIDYYQREYRWGAKQVKELIDDLADKFQDSYAEDHERSAVEGYGHYFLGSVITCNRGGRKYVIDGQQRITTLTLLLMHLHRQLGGASTLADLIYSEKYGQRSFNLDVPERTACMDALYNEQPFDTSGQPESVINIQERFQDIVEYFPGELTNGALPYFADWLIENVYLVEITAYSDADAYEIFETMNDRGMSLTSTEMLKGYLLANITDTDSRNTANDVWRSRVAALQNLSKEADADAIKTWLRSQHAETARDRRTGAEPGDVERINTEFHRWVRENAKKRLSLNSSSDFSRFILEDFTFYCHWYEKCVRASWTLTDGLEAIYFNHWNGFHIQHSLLLAPLSRSDDEEQIILKVRLVASFIDILLVRYMWEWGYIPHSNLQHTMSRLASDIRSTSALELADKLTARLDDGPSAFVQSWFGLYRNRRQLHRILARMTDYVETQSGLGSRYSEYVRGPYQIEHIWANHPELHEDEFSDPNDFSTMRNRIGGLLLLPGGFNASYGDMPYKEKREHYYGQNLLAQSLHERTYENNPGFLGFIATSGLPFKPHAEFKKRDLEERQDLFRHLAKRMWNPAILRQIAAE